MLQENKYTYFAWWCYLNGGKIRFPRPALFHFDSAQVLRVCCICQYNRNLFARFFIFPAPPHSNTVFFPKRQLTETGSQLLTPRATTGFVNGCRCFIATFHPMPLLRHFSNILLTDWTVQLWGSECIIRAGAMPICVRYENIKWRHF